MFLEYAVYTENEQGVLWEIQKENELGDILNVCDHTQ
jgi:hypothetical protein